MLGVLIVASGVSIRFNGSTRIMHSFGVSSQHGFLFHCYRLRRPNGAMAGTKREGLRVSQPVCVRSMERETSGSATL